MFRVSSAIKNRKDYYLIFFNPVENSILSGKNKRSYSFFFDFNFSYFGVFSKCLQQIIYLPNKFLSRFTSPLIFNILNGIMLDRDFFFLQTIGADLFWNQMA